MLPFLQLKPILILCVPYYFRGEVSNMSVYKRNKCWRICSVVKNIYFSCRGHLFYSQNTHSSSQPPITPIPRALMLFSGFQGCYGYSQLSPWLFLEWTTIQKWRAHLWSRSWGWKTIKRGRCGKPQTPLQDGPGFSKPMPMNMGKQPMCACARVFCRVTAWPEAY